MPVYEQCQAQPVGQCTALSWLCVKPLTHADHSHARYYTTPCPHQKRQIDWSRVSVGSKTSHIQTCNIQLEIFGRDISCGTRNAHTGTCTVPGRANMIGVCGNGQDAHRWVPGPAARSGRRTPPARSRGRAPPPARPRSACRAARPRSRPAPPPAARTPSSTAAPLRGALPGFWHEQT